MYSMNSVLTSLVLIHLSTPPPKQKKKKKKTPNLRCSMDNMKQSRLR